MLAKIISGQQVQNNLQLRHFRIESLILRIVMGGAMLEAGLNKLLSGSGYSLGVYKLTILWWEMARITIDPGRDMEAMSC